MSSDDLNLSASVYVELDALTSWSSQITTINNEAMAELNSLISAISDLNSYWEGNIATGFNNDSSDLIMQAKKYHSKMIDVPNFLIEVANAISDN